MWKHYDDHQFNSFCPYQLNKTNDDYCDDFHDDQDHQM